MKQPITASEIGNEEDKLIANVIRLGTQNLKERKEYCRKLKLQYDELQKKYKAAMEIIEACMANMSQPEIDRIELLLYAEFEILKS